MLPWFLNCILKDCKHQQHWWCQIGNAFWLRGWKRLLFLKIKFSLTGSENRKYTVMRKSDAFCVQPNSQKCVTFRHFSGFFGKFSKIIKNHQFEHSRTISKGCFHQRYWQTKISIGLNVPTPTMNKSYLCTLDRARNILARTIFSSFSKCRTVGRHAGDHHGSPFPNRVFSVDTS